MNWEGWQFPGKEQIGDSITMEEGGIAFQRVLACEDCPQVVVCITDIYPRIERWIRLVKHDQPGADDAWAENSTQYQQRPHLSNPYVPPTTELEQFMADTWQKFFGIQQVGIEDDFFELGGDSLKALQLINILNNSGLHVTVDKIFLHQTISKICRKMIQKEDNIPQRDYRSIENYISENYGIKAYYKNYQVNHAVYRVLYIVREDKDIGKLLVELKEKFKDIYPNFIKSMKAGEEIINRVEIDPGSFSTMMGLTNREIKQEEILEEFNKNDRFIHLLKENNIVRKYEVSPVQRAFLETDPTIERNNILFSYDFTYPIELEEIKKIIIKIINENSLLRSIIVKKHDIYYIREFDSFTNIQLPFFDISNYSFDCKEKIREILQQHLEKPFEVIDRVLYRAIIVKSDNSNYKLIFMFNHLIFDGESVLLLEEQIEGRKETLLDKEEKKERIDYYDYTTFLNNLKYENLNLENYLSIPDFYEYVGKALKSNKTKEIKEDFFEIDLSILKGRAKDIYNEILLLSFSKLIGNVYGIDKVPILFYSYGRNYKARNFWNIIGTFQDIIPVLFHRDRNRDDNFKDFLENFLDYREYIKNSNLNFMNFVLKKYLQGADYLRLLSSPFKFNPLFGLYERFKIMPREKVSKIQRQEKVDVDRVRFEMVTSKDLHTDNIFIRFLHNSIYETHQLKALFIKDFQDVAEYFNADNFTFENRN